MMECLTPTVSFDLFLDNYFTSFRLFVCWPTLELTTFEQEVFSTKIGYPNTLLNLVNLTEICSALEQSWKKIYSRVTTKSIPLLQPEHGFCQKICSEQGQTQDWYPNEKMVVVRVCLNDRCCSSGCVGNVCIN